MTVVELQEKLIEDIRKTDDKGFLGYISTIFENKLDLESVYQMSAEETEAVKEGLDDLNNGRWISNEESNKRADEWLKK